MDLLRSARAWVVACLLVKHHQPSLARGPGPYANITALVSPGLAPLLHRCPASVPPCVERLSLRSWSAFGAWKVRGDGCLCTGLVLAAARLLIGFRLVLWLSARPERCWMVLDDVLDVICVVCLDSLVNWFCLGFVGWRDWPIYVGGVRCR
jgi:hypothetical protein